MKYIGEEKNTELFIHKFELKDKEQVKIIVEITIDFMIVHIKSKEYNKEIVLDKNNIYCTMAGIKAYQENNILTIEIKKKIPDVIYELCIEIK
jgi:hypothetical protein